MYQTLKKLIPSKFIKKHEPFLRSIIALVYRGSYCECNLCGYQLRKFVLLPTGDLLCPNCASMPRNRRLWQLIGTLAAGKKILHFSPPKSLQKKLRNLPSTTYITTDYAGEFNADKKFDITQIDEKDNTYDLIICYHVLEHIIDDISAMNELYRVLKPNGQCYIQTPFKTGKTYEDYSINTPEERLKHFDQEDHVRIYSASGLTKRLTAAGFKVTPHQFNMPEIKYGFKQNETVLIAEKQAVSNLQ